MTNITGRTTQSASSSAADTHTHMHTYCLLKRLGGLYRPQSSVHRVSFVTAVTAVKLIASIDCEMHNNILLHFVHEREREKLQFCSNIYQSIRSHRDRADPGWFTRWGMRHRASNWSCCKQVACWVKFVDSLSSFECAYLGCVMNVNSNHTSVIMGTHTLTLYANDIKHTQGLASCLLTVKYALTEGKIPIKNRGKEV